MTRSGTLALNAIAEMLGGTRVFKHPISSEHELIQAVRAGLPMSALEAVLAQVATAKALQREVVEIVGSARTLQRKRAAHRDAMATPAKKRRAKTVTLSPGESDRLARFARLLVRAQTAIGDREKAQRWLAKPNRALGGERPVTLLDSDAGTLAVERVLGRIEHGVYS